MSDAFTPNLGLTKPDVGGSDDTWGEKLNVNFDILDTSIQDVEDAISAILPPLPANAVPIVEGTGTVGVSTKYAREDHIHPAGSSSVPATAVPLVESGTGAVGVSTKYAREDHVHPLGPGGGGGGASVTISDTAPVSATAGDLWWESDTGFLYVYYNDGTSSQWVSISGGGGSSVSPAIAVPLMDATPGVVGTSVLYAREDHKHPTDTSRAAVTAIREKLTANRYYYVATTGLDSNDGLTAGAPFLTLQKAMDVIGALDCSIWDVIVVVADGTYSTSLVTLYLKSYLGSGAVTFVGNTTTPGNVVIVSTTTTPVRSLAVGGQFTLSGFKLVGAVQDIAVLTATTVTLVFMEYAGGGANYRVYVANKGQITLSGSYHKFTNGAAGQLGAFLCEQYAILYLNSATITWTANVTYGVTLTVRAIGYCEAAATVCTITGFTVTGIRYNVVTNAVVNGTGNINLFPGTVAGAVATGGVYQ